MSSNDDSVKIDPEILKTLGRRVYDHVPVERQPYNPAMPKGNGNILKSNDPPKQFEFGIGMSVKE